MLSSLVRGSIPVTAIIVLLIVAAYFSPHIWLHGEAREALVIQDIVKNNDWVLPFRNGELPSKPILYHWIAAVFALLIGLSDFTIRLPSVIAAAMMMWTVYSLGRLDSNRNTGLLGVGILAATFEFWDSGTAARVDMLFAALIAVALTGWYLWYTSASVAARAAAYLAVAFAVLVKGPAGIVLPVLVVSVFLLIERDVKRFFGFLSWPWLVTILVIDGGWYVAAYYRGGANFWYKQIIYENIQRFFGTGEFETHQPHFSQAVWLVTQLFPWSLILVGSFIRCVRGHRQDLLGRFLHAWWLAIFGFFLIAKGQRPVYLLPIYPAVALLAAREIILLLDAKTEGLRRWTTHLNWRPTAAIILLFVIFSLAMAIPISRTIREDSNDQEDFVEQVVPRIPITGVVYAAPDFPETVLMVLAYRTNRNIGRQAATCEGDYYYLSIETALHCSDSTIAAPVAKMRDQGVRLLHVSHSRARGETPTGDP
jgi:4-amino-4-deoxy-L-arabinose transferase-like glycosyltransferase